MLHPVDQAHSLNRVLGSLTGQSDDYRVGWEPIVLVEYPSPVVDDILPLVRSERLHLQRHVLFDQLTRPSLKTRLNSNMPLRPFPYSLRDIPDQLGISPCRSSRAMGRVRVGYSLLRHDCREQIHDSVMVRHETPLVFQLVQENVFAMD